MPEQTPALPLRWLSDLHLDRAGPAERSAVARRLRRDARPLVVTGDISTAPWLVDDLVWLSDTAAAPLWFVLGNHDHYGSSVGAVRDSVLALADNRPSIRWLPPVGVVNLDDTTALVGVDGWADGRFGNPLTARFVLNDDRLIAEIAAQPGRVGKLAVKRALADADAARLAVLLSRVPAGATTVVIATHVPPFVEALPRTGRLASPEWYPLLVCGATGAVIGRVAAEQPARQFVVLCGHTHVAADVRVAANVRCRVMSQEP